MFMSRRRLPAACSQRVWSNAWVQELGIAGRFEQVVEAFLGSCLGGRASRRKRLRMRLAMGKSSSSFQAVGQALIAGQDDGQDGAGVQVGAGQQAQLGEDQRVHFLGFVDDEHGPIERAVDVCEPFFPQRFGAVPAVVGRERHAKQVAQFAIEVGQVGLGPGQDADAQIAQVAQVLGQDAQGGALAGARLADDQGKAAFADLLFDAPAEALGRRREPQSRGRALRGRRG